MINIFAITGYRVFFLIIFITISFIFLDLPTVVASTNQIQDKDVDSAHKTIGIIVPLEHEAMLQIIAGITDTLADIK